MPCAEASRRGRALNWRLAVNGIQKASSCVGACSASAASLGRWSGMAGSVVRDRPTVRSWRLGRHLRRPQTHSKQARRASPGRATPGPDHASTCRSAARTAGAGSGFATRLAKCGRTSQLVAAAAANTKARLRDMGIGGALQHCKALESIANRQGSPMMRQTTASWAWSVSLPISQRVI
ncbi:hypothetical protein XAB3213_2640009 [Xanthomonas citri pv. bilvae]|nr:hypothetical protein XAB3213_2640009 [Xanthomonas citri pv. bilvae]